jgi:hypothetical protein
VRSRLGTLLIAAVAIAGCGSSSSSSGSTASSSVKVNPAAEASARHHAEAIYERSGISFYVGELKASTVRFSFPCKQATKEGEGGHEAPISGQWDCAGWGLIAAGEPEAGKCEFVEGNVRATGLVGKPEGEAMTFSGSPCQLDFGLGTPGKKPRASLVAAWASKRNAEAQRSKAIEASPESQAQKREEANEEAEEAKRTEEAHSAERGE